MAFFAHKVKKKVCAFLCENSVVLLHLLPPPLNNRFGLIGQLLVPPPLKPRYAFPPVTLPPHLPSQKKAQEEACCFQLVFDMAVNGKVQTVGTFILEKVAFNLSTIFPECCFVIFPPDHLKIVIK